MIKKKYSCGYNSGECGLGHLHSPQTTPTLIPNLPSNIVQFVCGPYHNLFLDSEGNVFSVGNNSYGSLGHNKKNHILNQIPNIPPIQIISTASHTSYLVDFEGNVWSFGYNAHGQLGHGDCINKTIPTKIEGLPNFFWLFWIRSFSCQRFSK